MVTDVFWLGDHRDRRSRDTHCKAQAKRLQRLSQALQRQQCLAGALMAERDVTLPRVVRVVPRVQLLRNRPKQRYWPSASSCLPSAINASPINA